MSARPFTLLVAALGGEGGGVLTDWIVSAAESCDLPVQSTSIPGVAQRTGATTYYLEIFPARRELLAGRQPVMSLTPNPGNVDVMVASELLEAGRAMQNGYISPDRTTLVASTHRIYATVEKSHMAEGRFPPERVLEAAHQLARRAVLFDMRKLAQESGTVINAVLFGAMAGSGALPLPREACEAAIRRAGKGAEASLRGFAAGFELAAGSRAAPPAEARKTPPDAKQILELGAARLRDYQDDAYALLYLQRVGSLGDNANPALVGEVGRQLALWMSYEDIIRVADLKTRGSRFERVKSEVRAGQDQVLAIDEYLHPGVREIAETLPGAIGRAVERPGWLRRTVERFTRKGRIVTTSSLGGFLMLRAVAGMKRWRRSTTRYAAENAAIEAWLARIAATAATHPELAVEVAQCQRLVKGYSDTHERGVRNYETVMAALQKAGPSLSPATLQELRDAALADEHGSTLAATLARHALA